MHSGIPSGASTGLGTVTMVNNAGRLGGLSALMLLTNSTGAPNLTAKFENALLRSFRGG